MIADAKDNFKYVQLTKRDVQLLELLSSHVLMSFSQIQRVVFGNKNSSTVLNRLKLLELANYIKRIRVHRIRHPMFEKEIGVVFQISTLGMKELQKYFPEKVLAEKIPQIHGRQLDHDLIVVDVAENLKNEFLNFPYVNGAYLESKKPGDPRPDGAFKNPMNQKFTAIEIELTVKSSDRYREILSAYRVHSAYEKVIFYTGSDGIGRKLASEMKGYNVDNLNDFRDPLFEIRILKTPNLEPK